MKRLMAFAAGLAVLASTTMVWAQAARIENGKKVKLEYKLTVDGAMVDNASSDKPFEYVHGQGMIIKGLEKALEGMKAGESKKVTIEPAEAYGDLDEKKFFQFPKSKLPADVNLQKGQVIGLMNDKKQQMKAVVWEIKETDVVLNLNHPLAGKTLNFDVKIISVE